MSVSSSPWLTAAEAAQYAKRGKRFLAREVKAGRLRAAVIGGRRELFFRTDWIDAWLDDQAMPIVLPMRRRA